MVRIFDGLARQKRLALVVNVSPPELNIDVHLDPLRFKQVLSNLISNAIKFTEKGQIRISLELLDSDVPACSQVQLTVQDSGIGITAEDQRRLFEPFTQASHGRNRAISGTGLGLVISRSLCEMMGGQLQLSSQPGIGTQVRVSLPLAIMPAEVKSRKHEPQIQTALTPLNVLVVDDHPANRLLMCQQLEFLGHHFSIAEEGQSALEQWKNGAFDLVIADCNMPVMNGYELTRAIRRHEELTQRPACTVLGFTANAQPEEVLRCKRAGMNECLFKPLSLSVLSQWVASVQPILDAPVLHTSAFNLQGLYALTGGNPAQTRRLLTELLKSSRIDRRDLQALSPGRDHQALAEMAHRIKGAARIAQASRLINSCDALEQACLQALPVEEIERRCKASNFAILELEKALEQQLTLTDHSRMTGP